MKPVVLCLSGHDPSGGAGIQADIEAVQACGAFPASLITALTVQNSQKVYALQPIEANLFEQQLQCLLADYQPAVVKIGLLPSMDLAQIIMQYCCDYPWVLDPILHSGAGDPLGQQAVIQALLSHTELILPNQYEALSLSQQNHRDGAAQFLLDQGCQQVLITGTDAHEEAWIQHHFYSRSHRRIWSWRRLPGSYHGSGCTLAASIAALKAQGLDWLSAIEQAQTYTYLSLQKGLRLGQGQIIPQRC